MPFIGNQPAEKYSSFQKQDFTTSATTSYTLDHPVANGNEIALFINFVRQEPTAAYTASGTSLTLTSATSASDDMYCVYLGKAVQTVNPPNSSVGTSQLDSSLDFSSKTITLADNMKNTPAFYAYMNANQSVSNSTWTKAQLNAEVFDTDSAFDSTTNYRFTVPSGEAGKYVFSYSTRTTDITTSSMAQIALQKNGTLINAQTSARSYPNHVGGGYPNKNIVLDLAAADYIELMLNHNSGSNEDFGGNSTVTSAATFLSGYKLIGV